MAAINHILLVEDNPYDVELITETFRKYDLDNELYVVRDGEEALDYLYRRGKFQLRPGLNPMLILLDIRLPKVNGIEVLHQIKNDEALKDIPVVILTAYPEARQLVENTGLSVVFMEKPINFEKFQQTFKKIVQPMSKTRRESIPKVGTL